MATVKHGLLERMVGAALLRVSIYEEVEADTSATRQALFVVGLVSLATGIGFLAVGASGGVAGLVVSTVLAILGWAAWAGITYFIGTRILGTPKTHADWRQLARTLGFAQSPGILRVLLFVPVIGVALWYATLAWQLMTMVVAVRQALDYTSTWRAAGVVLLGFIPYFTFMLLLG